MPAADSALALEVAETLEVLDNRTRLRTLGVLYNADSPLSFRELEAAVGVSGPRLAQHLKRLVRSALVVNQYRKSEAREYSFYELSSLGEEWLKRIGLVGKRNLALLVPA